MSQTDYDADGRPVKQYMARYDNASGSAVVVGVGVGDVAVAGAV